jgi:hypothetical protein
MKYLKNKINHHNQKVEVQIKKEQERVKIMIMIIREVDYFNLLFKILKDGLKGKDKVHILNLLTYIILKIFKMVNDYSVML